MICTLRRTILVLSLMEMLCASSPVAEKTARNNDDEGEVDAAVKAFVNKRISDLTTLINQRIDTKVRRLRADLKAKIPKSNTLPILTNSSVFSS